MTVRFSDIDELLLQLTTIHQAHPLLEKADLALKLKKSAPHADPLTIAVALDTFMTRRDPEGKFGTWGSQGYFVSALVEQASREAIARYRSQYFTGLQHVLEIGTGTGSDTAALARVSHRVTSIESDPIRAELARHNLAQQGITNVTVVVGDALEVLSSLDMKLFDGFFADPARRTKTGQRVKDAADYSPPLLDLLSLTHAKVRAIKVSPGLFFDAPSLGWSRQFIGNGDECLEQTLWFGSPIVDSSVYLPDQQIGWNPPTPPVMPLAAAEDLTGFLFEAHAVVNRSQHLAQFFAQRRIAQIAPDVAYGIAPSRPPSHEPLLSAFEIVTAMPFALPELRAALTTLGWTSRTEIKKRNYTGDIDHLRAALHLPGHYHDAPFGTIVLFTWKGSPWVVIARRCED